MKRLLSLLGLLSCLSACATETPTGAPVSAAAGIAIEVSGDLVQSGSWTADQLLAEFADEVVQVEHQTKNGSIPLRAIPLQSLLDSRGLQPKTDRKHPEQAFAVLLEARDGYAVAFSYEELVPDRAGQHQVFLGLAELNGPILARFGPARLVTTNPGGNSRRLAAIERIRVLDLTTTSSN